ncbi:hypothetical protein B0H14DRAFT_2650552 [Mycena olivaceomarginata]|nr:hypothetical protein B0H14DRAFT_2650552 [Mycena olivaceomarginata]
MHVLAVAPLNKTCSVRSKHPNTNTVLDVDSLQSTPFNTFGHVQWQFGCKPNVGCVATTEKKDTFFWPLECMLGVECCPYLYTSVDSSDSSQLKSTWVQLRSQQKDNRMKSFFCQGEMDSLLRDCKDGLEECLDFFQIEMEFILSDVTDMQKDG